jgi:hypothetical protein
MLRWAGRVELVGGKTKHIQGYDGENLKKDYSGRPRRRWEYNIKMYLKKYSVGRSGLL